MFGTGKYSETVLNELRDNNIQVIAFCNSFVSETEETHLGLPVISINMLFDIKYKECVVVMSNYKYQYEICKNLLASGFPANRIFVLYDIVHDTVEQYFGPDFIQPVSNEVFIDGGAYNGDSLLKFINFCNNNYQHIYAFEPAPHCYKALKDNINSKNLKRISAINKALWHKKDILDFKELEGPIHIAPRTSRIVNIANEDTIKIPVIPLDEVVRDEQVTFIKLDIEGAELNALKGAKMIIKKNKPRLAICIYHKPDDFIEIPLYIMNLVPDYRFWIRHHKDYQTPIGTIFNETVLYAVI